MSQATSIIGQVQIACTSPAPNEIAHWNELFAQRAQISSIFEAITHDITRRSRTNAIVVGSAWYVFSANVGELLCSAAARMRDNNRRFTLAQIVWEELGSGHANEIHADTFLQSMLNIGITQREVEEAQVKWLTKLPVAKLVPFVRSAESDDEVLGFCAGLEQPANENIETIFNGLAFNDEAAASLGNEYFFRMHRVIEDGHISLGTSNFLRFCNEQTSRTLFLCGFDNAITFWREFWACVHDAIGRAHS